jgi:hypothetical protein
VREVICPASHWSYSLEIAVREELELPFDEEACCQALEDAISKQQLAIDEFVRKLKPVVAEPIASTGVSQTAG